MVSTSFNFTIHEVTGKNGEVQALVPKGTAYFTGNRNEASYIDSDVELQFVFEEEPIYAMRIKGLQKLEGNVYLNSQIPGYEFD